MRSPMNDSKFPRRRGQGGVALTLPSPSGPSGRRTLASICGAIAFAIGAPATGDAIDQLDGNQLLDKADSALDSFADATFESTLIIRRGSGAREYRFTTFQRGERRLVRFTAPGEVKKMGVLVEDRETMYVFLPGFDKVRRMGTHVRSQSFMGSDFSLAEVAQSRLAPLYQARRLGDDAGALRLELTARAGKSPEFPRLELWLDRASLRPTRLECFDAAGARLKTELRSDEKRAGPAALEAGRVTVTDHRHEGRTSEIEYKMTARNQGLPDELFSLRSLARGQ